MKNILVYLCLFFSATLFAKDKIVVFHAGSLSVPFEKIEKEFEKIYPNYDVLRESSGSVIAARKVTELHRKADVVASADYKVIDDFLVPKYASFNAHFATNEMVLAYNTKSKFKDKINSKNWTDIVLKNGVKIGHSNPNLDPGGYRAIFSVKLAQKYYKIPNFYKNLLGYAKFYKAGKEKKSKIFVRPKETDLLALLEVGAVDYIFIYKSVAKQHNLSYITFPKEVSLSNSDEKDFYKNTSFDITGKKPNTYINIKASAMIYGITAIKNSEDKISQGAIDFINFVVSKKGQDIMKKFGQGIINPVKITGNSELLGK